MCKKPQGWCRTPPGQDRVKEQFSGTQLICETFSLTIDLCSNCDSNFVHMIHRNSPLAVRMGDFGIPGGDKVIGMLIVFFRI